MLLLPVSLCGVGRVGLEPCRPDELEYATRRWRAGRTRAIRRIQSRSWRPSSTRACRLARRGSVSREARRRARSSIGISRRRCRAAMSKHTAEMARHPRGTRRAPSSRRSPRRCRPRALAPRGEVVAIAAPSRRRFAGSARGSARRDGAHRAEESHRRSSRARRRPACALADTRGAPFDQQPHFSHGPITFRSCAASVGSSSLAWAVRLRFEELCAPAVFMLLNSVCLVLNLGVPTRERDRHGRGVLADMLLDFARFAQMRTRIGGIVWAIFDRVFEDFGGGFAERFERRKAPFGLNLRDLELGGHASPEYGRISGIPQ